MLFRSGGADVLAVDSGLSSALHYAVENGDHLAARLLLEHGADVDQPDHRGRTPIELAVERNREELIGLLRAARKKDDRKERETPETGRAQGRG